MSQDFPLSVLKRLSSIIKTYMFSGITFIRQAQKANNLKIFGDKKGKEPKL
jgi:hypothetical protein